MAYKRKDHFYRLAKREKKASRAAYKLSELQKRFKLMAKGDTVLDLGCAPGGWLKEISTFVGPSGRVIGIDPLPLKIKPPKNCTFIQASLEDKGAQQHILELTDGKADCVLSDMSPNLSGIAFADAYRSYETAMLALDICTKALRQGGNFAVKIFPGDEFAGYVKILESHFLQVSTAIPKATRKTSSERYIIALGYKADA